MKRLTYILLFALTLSVGAPVLDAAFGTDIIALIAADNKAKER